MTKSPTRVAAGKKSRRKGSSNENKLAKQFKAWWGAGEWARTPASGGWATPQHREDFRTCGDLICSDPSFNFCVEAKKQEGWTLDQLLLNDGCIIHSWWEQCVEETPFGMASMLVFNKNRQKPMVMLKAVGSEVYAQLKLCNKRLFNTEDKKGECVVIFALSDLFDIDPCLLGKK